MLEKAGTALIMHQEILFCAVLGVYKSNLSDGIEKMSCYLAIEELFMPMMLLNGSRIKSRRSFMRRVAQ